MESGSRSWRASISSEPGVFRQAEARGHLSGAGDAVAVEGLQRDAVEKQGELVGLGLRRRAVRFAAHRRVCGPGRSLRHREGEDRPPSGERQEVVAEGQGHEIVEVAVVAVVAAVGGEPEVGAFDSDQRRTHRVAAQDVGRMIGHPGGEQGGRGAGGERETGRLHHQTAIRGARTLNVEEHVGIAAPLVAPGMEVVGTGVGAREDQIEGDPGVVAHVAEPAGPRGGSRGRKEHVGHRRVRPSQATTLGQSRPQPHLVVRWILAPIEPLELGGVGFETRCGDRLVELAEAVADRVVVDPHRRGPGHPQVPGAHRQDVGVFQAAVGPGDDEAAPGSGQGEIVDGEGRAGTGAPIGRRLRPA